MVRSPALSDHLLAMRGAIFPVLGEKFPVLDFFAGRRGARPPYEAVDSAINCERSRPRLAARDDESPGYFPCKQGSLDTGRFSVSIKEGRGAISISGITPAGRAPGRVPSAGPVQWYCHATHRETRAGRPLAWRSDRRQHWPPPQ